MKHNVANSYLSSFKTFTCTGRFRLGRDHRGSSSLASCTRQGQTKTCVKPVWCVTCSWKKSKKTPNPLLMFDKTFWEYFPFSISPLLPPNSGVLHICFRQVYVLLLSLLCVNKDIHENWGWRRNETHTRSSWPRKEAPVDRAVGLTLKDCQGTFLCFPDSSECDLDLLWEELQASRQRLLLFLLQVPICSRKSHFCLLMVKGDRYRVTAEPQCSTCGSNPAHLTLRLQNLLTLFAS